MTALLITGAVAGTLGAQIATVIIAFFLVMATLYAVAWKPVINLIDERRESIRKEFDSIDRKQADLDSKIRDYEERLRQIDAEARDRMNKAIDEGKRTATALVDDARKTAEDMKAKAVTDIRIELEKARVELRNDIVKLTIGATEKLLKSELNDDRHRVLVGSFITELEAKKNS